MGRFSATSALEQRTRARWLGLAAAVAVMSSSVGARALPEYPGFIQEQLGSHCAVTCLLCHTCPGGGLKCMKPNPAAGTTVPDRGGNRGQGEFFANLIAVNGGKNYPTTPAMLAAYLQNLADKPCSSGTTLPCDSDGDQVQDVPELRADSNPDEPDAPGAACDAIPKYGCGASIAPSVASHRPSSGGLLVLATLGFGWLRRRRRAHGVANVDSQLR